MKKRNSPPLNVHFRHNNGFICAGSLRIAREDFDTNPSDTFKKELFDWICKTLNDEIEKQESCIAIDSYDPSSPNGYD